MDIGIWYDQCVILDYHEQGIVSFVEVLDASRHISGDVK